MIINACTPMDVLADLRRELNQRIKAATADRNKAYVATDRAEANGVIHALAQLERDLASATIIGTQPIATPVGAIVTARNPRKMRRDGASR